MKTHIRFLLVIFAAFAIFTHSIAQLMQDERMTARRTATQTQSTPPTINGQLSQSILDRSDRFVLKPDLYGIFDFDTTLARRFQRVMDSISTKYAVRGMSAAVLIPGKGIWLGTFGYSTAAPDSIRPETIFNISSQSKTFTSVLILKLAEEGKLSLNDSIGRYLPNLPAGISPTITIRQLLTHTSGLYCYINDNNAKYNSLTDAQPNRCWTPEEILSDFALPKNMKPDSVHYYSNTNTVLAAMIVRNISQTSVSTQLHQRILTPLSMARTFFPHEDSLIGPIAHPWYSNTDVSSWYNNALHSTLWSAGSMYSTAEDMVRWVNAVYGGHLLSKNSLAQMQTGVVIPVADRLSYGGISEQEYGLFAIRYSFLGDTLWGHSGGFTGYCSFGTYRPDDSMSVVVLSNWWRPTTTAISIHVWETVSALYRQNVVTAVKQVLHLPSTHILEQNYPNPFNPSTTIDFQLPTQSHVTLKIFDLLGREVAVLVNEKKEAGRYSVQWDASRMSSGVYFYTLQTGQFHKTMRMILIK